MKITLKNPADAKLFERGLGWGSTDGVTWVPSDGSDEPGIPFAKVVSVDHERGIITIEAIESVKP